MDLGVGIVSIDYVVLILIIGIMGGFGFWKIIKHFKYELNFNESLLFSISILALTILCLADFSLTKISVGWEFALIIIIYFLLLLILYYIIRSLKLKKYIPLKAIVGYILISVVNIVILFNMLDKTSNIGGLDALALFIIYVIIYAIYIILLLLINTIIFIIKLIKKNNIIYKNQNYRISKYSFINIALIILVIGLIFVIDYYNEHNYNKMLKTQKEIVINYLSKEYPTYEFEITNIYEEKVDCWMFGCRTPVIRNDIVNKTINRNFSIDVKKEDLTIYDDGFKSIFEEEQKNSKEEKIKKYLKDNYNISLNYKINNEKIEDVEFIISKNYQKEEIELFAQDMKNVFNYIDSSFYNIDYVILNFENGNPFYEGEYEYSKTKGSIKENSMTNELCIMVNDEYIFVEK